MLYLFVGETQLWQDTSPKSHHSLKCHASYNSTHIWNYFKKFSLHPSQHVQLALLRTDEPQTHSEKAVHISNEGRLGLTSSQQRGSCFSLYQLCILLSGGPHLRPLHDCPHAHVFHWWWPVDVNCDNDHLLHPDRFNCCQFPCAYHADEYGSKAFVMMAPTIYQEKMCSLHNMVYAP